MKLRIKQLLLIGLGGLWAVLLLVRGMMATEPPQLPLQFMSGKQRGISTAPNYAGDDLHVKQLVQARNLPVTPRRNIFVPGKNAQLASNEGRKVARPKVAIPAPPPLPPPVAPVAAPVPAPPQPSPEELAVLAAQQQKEAMVRQLRQEMGQYRYLGYLRNDGQQRAFLGKGKEIYIIREGDTLEGKFLVAGIEAGTVTLKEGVNNLETTLELKKEKLDGSL